MSQRPSRWSLLACSALLGVAVLGPGCQDNWGTVKEKQREKYYDMRSGLMLEMAQSHFESGQLDTAEKTVRDASRVQPNNPKLWLMAGRIALERGKLERAQHHFDNSIALYTALAEDRKITLSGPDAADPHYYKGVVLQRWQRWDDAYNSYQTAFELEKDNPTHLIAMSEMLVPQDRVDDAITLLEEKLVYFDSSASVRSALAHLHRMKGQHEKAADLFKQAAVLAPNNVKLREELAMSQSAAGQHTESAITLSTLLTHPEMTKRDDLRRKLAHTQMAAGQSTAARQTLLELTRRDAATADDWVHLAKLAWKDGDLSGTLFAAHNVTRMAPDKAEGYLLAGMVWQKRGHTDNALAMFDRAADLDPTDPTPLVFRGMTLQQANRPAAAAESYNEALQRQPNHPHALRLLAAVEAD